MKYVIFSIDNQHDAFWRGVLAGMFKGAKGNLIPCVGSYAGETEFSWLCLREDFDNLIAGTDLIAEQESIMAISECNKQYARLEFLDGERDNVGLGSLKSVGKEEAMQHSGWTYRPDINIYWVAVKGNPDTVPPANGWLSDQQVKALHAANNLIETIAERSGYPEYMRYKGVAADLREAFKQETVH